LVAVEYQLFGVYKGERLTDDVTPFIFKFRVVLLSERLFEDMTEEVETSPLIFVVKVFPEIFCVNKFIILVARDETPLTIVCNKFPDDEAVTELIIEVVETEPFISEDRVLREDDNKLFIVVEETDPPFSTLIVLVEFVFGL
jgi:hypothetical protein